MSLLTAVIPLTASSKRIQNVCNIVHEGIKFEMKFIIVFDSNEQLPDTLRKLQLRFERNVKLIHGLWGNPGDSRNMGLMLVDTLWVTFWDSDDYPKIEEFVKMTKIAHSENVDCCVGEFEIRNFNASKGLKVPIIRNKWHYSSSKFPAFWRFAFKSEIAKNIEFPSLTIGEDLVFLGRALSEINSISVYQRVVYIYVIGFEDQLSLRKTSIDDLCEVYLLLSHLKKSNLVESEILIAIIQTKALITVLKNSRFNVKVKNLKKGIAYLALQKNQISRRIIIGLVGLIGYKSTVFRNRIK